MYLRKKQWLNAVTPAVHTESGWINTFRLEETDAIDVRFALLGYGWKPNPTDENLQALEKGSYKIYYRLVGDSVWTFLARVESARASQDVATVYLNVGFSLGVVAEGHYEFMIEADKGSRYTAWGGTVEGIASGGVFYSGLQVRVDPYKMCAVNDALTITENAGAQLV